MQICEEADERQAGPAPRLPGLDAARGMAVAAMAAYHLLFDLKFYFGRDIFSENPWVWPIGAMIITAAFLFFSGVSARVADSGGRRFFRRQALLGAAAAGVSLVTYLLVPEWWIRFGVLHCLFVAGFACQGLRNSPRLAAGVAGVLWVAWAAGVIPEIPYRTGLPTLDFVPIVPWISLPLLGVALGGRLRDPLLSSWGKGLPVLRWMGRHSLAIYLAHQPVIMGVLAGAGWLLS